MRLLAEQLSRAAGLEDLCGRGSWKRNVTRYHWQAVESANTGTLSWARD